MIRGIVLAFVSMAVIVASTVTIVLLSANTSSAGIGPRGFAFYARQGILHAITITYGKGNNPYTVRCQDHPNYRTLADNVSCQIRLKP